MERLRCTAIVASGAVYFLVSLIWEYLKALKPVLKFFLIAILIFSIGFLFWLLAFLCLGGYAWASFWDWKEGKEYGED